MRLKKQVAKLEAQPADLSALRQIYELAGQVPADLITHGARFLPGGFQARDVLIQVAANALGDATRKAQAQAALLDKARSDLAKAEAALAELP